MNESTKMGSFPSMIHHFRLAVQHIVFYTLAVILFTILALVCWQVISRYALNDPSVFTEEIVRFLLIWLGCLSAVYAFGSNRHVALTLVYHKLPANFRKIVTVVHHVVVLIFGTVFFIWGGMLLMKITSMQVSSVLLIPLNYVYSIFPFCGVILAIYEIFHIIETLSVQDTIKGE